MSDMMQFIQPKSDQINADDLIGVSKTIKITGVKFTSTEQPISIYFEGDNNKPYKPCKSMARVMVRVWGNESKNYIGRIMTLYRDDKVKWGGMAVGGIRISHMSHITEPVTMALTESKANRKPYTVNPLKIAEMAPPPAAPRAPSSRPEISPHDKKARQIKAAIDASPDAADMEALWNLDYAEDLAVMLKEKPDYHKRLLDAFDDRLAALQPVDDLQELLSSPPRDDSFPGDRK